MNMMLMITRDQPEASMLTTGFLKARQHVIVHELSELTRGVSLSQDLDIAFCKP